MTNEHFWQILSNRVCNSTSFRQILFKSRIIKKFVAHFELTFTIKCDIFEYQQNLIIFKHSFVLICFFLSIFHNTILSKFNLNKIWNYLYFFDMKYATKNISVLYLRLLIYFNMLIVPVKYGPGTILLV